MDGPGHYHTNRRQKYMVSLTCRILKKNDTNELIFETDVEKNSYRGEGLVGKDRLAIENDMYTQLYLK